VPPAAQALALWLLQPTAPLVGCKQNKSVGDGAAERAVPALVSQKLGMHCSKQGSRRKFQSLDGYCTTSYIEERDPSAIWLQPVLSSSIFKKLHFGNVLWRSVVLYRRFGPFSCFYSVGLFNVTANILDSRDR